MLYGRGSDIALARLTAVAGAASNGWQFVEVRREKEIAADASVIGDKVLRSAAEDALRHGHSMIVYEDELPLDS